MRVVSACVLLLLCCLSTAAPSRADSLEYSVSINAYWQYSAFYGAFGYSEPGNPVVDQFYASYDIYADGSVVPGTMTFSVVDNGGPLAGATPFVYGVVPTFCDPGIQPGQVGEGCTPPSNPPSGTFYAGGQTAWYDSEGFLIGAGATPGQVGTFTGSVATIDCVNYACAGGLLLCYDIDCAGGGTNPASGGYIIESVLPVATPEPASAFLLILGFLAVLALRRRTTSTDPAAT